MKDFPDVFPNELPGLPPNLKVKFAIELYISSLLMSITPYRMETKELKEMNTTLGVTWQKFHLTKHVAIEIASFVRDSTW